MELFVTIHLAKGLINFVIGDFSGSEPAVNFVQREEALLYIATIAERYAEKRGAIVERTVTTWK